MHDEDAFLQAMRERPDDATLRHVYADWLEERGDPRSQTVREELTQRQQEEALFANTRMSFR